VSAKYQTSRLDDPARLVLDLQTRTLRCQVYGGERVCPSNVAWRLGQSKPGLSRVVVDLAEFVPFSVRGDGSGLTISFESPAEAINPVTLTPARKRVKQILASAKVPEMPLPAWLTGKDLAFARPAREPAAPDRRIPRRMRHRLLRVPCGGQEIHGRPDLGEPEKMWI